MYTKLSAEFDYPSLRKDVLSVYKQIKDSAYGTEYEILANRNQSITVSEENSNDWTDGIAGKTFINKTRSDSSAGLQTQLIRSQNEVVNEKLYIHPLLQIKGTYLEQFINLFPNCYRWRISILPPRTTLSIHVDGQDHMNAWQGGSAVLDHRIHFSIKTNNRCFLMGWPDNFTSVKDSGEMISLNIANFKAGQSYLLDTSKIHCATNFSDEERIHLIASCSNEFVTAS